MWGVLGSAWPWRQQQQSEGDEAEESREQRLSRVMRPYEAFVVRLQRLLIWDNPLASGMFVVALNLLFW